MAVKTYPKKSQEKLCDHFIAAEFDCPCDKCTSTLVDEALVTGLRSLREALGSAIRINSGYRCQDYQSELAARGYETAIGISQHQLGKAADVMSEPQTGVELEKAARQVGFKAVGVGGTWIHVDLRDDKDRRWEYEKR